MTDDILPVDEPLLHVEPVDLIETDQPPTGFPPDDDETSDDEPTVVIA